MKKSSILGVEKVKKGREREDLVCGGSLDLNISL